MRKGSKMAAVTVAEVPAPAVASDLLLRVTTRGVATALGPADFVKIHAPDWRPLGWSEVHRRFVEEYPGRWAVQAFPPADQLVDGKNCYLLHVLGEGVEPEGLNVKAGR